MTVQSARVQQIVKGDDVTLTHQIMESVAFNAEIGRAPVEVNALDTVKFFYPLQDGTMDDIGYEGVAVSAYPASAFSVDIAGVIAATVDDPERGTKHFLSGKAQTIRAEITRQSGKLESHYLLMEVDIYERGFPVAPTPLDLP